MTPELIERIRHRLAGSGSGTGPMALAQAVRAEAGGPVGHAGVLDALKVLGHEFSGAGPLEGLLAEPEVTDVLVTAPDEVWVDGAAGLRRTEVRFPDDEAVRRLAQRLATASGRRLDDAQPYVDGWLPGVGRYGTVRLHAVLPPVAADGTCISLRVLRPAAHDLATLADSGTFDGDGLTLIETVISARLAFLVTGGTGAGKSTLLAAMLGAVDRTERILAVEDVGELRPSHPQFVRLVTRAPNVEGAGEVTLGELVRQALRMRPDRLVVGEVRGREVCELLTALNTGHEGGACTLHANSPAEVPARLEALAALGGLSRAALHSQLAAAVQVVLHMRRLPGGRRQLAEVGVLSRDAAGEIRVVPVWQAGEWTRRRPLLSALLELRGVRPPW
ncbi:TadA family conjugal transfer-associated ATPase [Amycolatopsis rhizosphaerae]|uniref:TadA family conjugal transfer-associated ATPase n=1 Tax=Amycolatopsis rhizosphaerae TaxID=2053003 RepID=A0A558B191_9PSEU|nr:TadA family conjugal transfer-associated ATPase [Amycolatopsis rhizosphaerae]TVT30264.1 TadA family conjugal transfer-associated ATPase [Amycolatopsis rhizosphaerae]